MDELDISGKRYISTRRAGREHGYHSDYIGQLIRGNKVKGQKVGRSWYVDEESLVVYLGKEYIAPAQAQPEEPLDIVAAPEEKPEEKEIVQPTAELRVQEEAEVLVQEKKVERKEEEKEILREEHHVPVRIEEKKDEFPSGLRYVPDNEPLLPAVAHLYKDADVVRERLIPRASPKRNFMPLAIVGVALMLAGLSIWLASSLSWTASVNGQSASVFYSLQY